MDKGSVLVLGGTGGIGKAIVRRLNREGRRVITASRSPAPAGSERPHVQLDLAADQLADQLTRVSQQHPEISCVIHCAGFNTFGAVASQDVATIDQLLSVNLRSAILVARHFLPRFIDGGQLVMVGSSLGSIGFPGYSAYCASKFGLRGFTEALQREYADRQCQITYVAPRATRTRMNSAKVDAMNTALGNHCDEPDRVAAQILQAMEKRQRRRFLGWPERLFIPLNGMLPRLVDRGIQRQLNTIRRYL
jgi:short-subunit dehydrogenase